MVHLELAYAAALSLKVNGVRTRAETAFWENTAQDLERRMFGATHADPVGHRDRRR